MTKITEKERLKLYDYVVRIGFVVPSVWDWDKYKQIKKIKQYIRKGYRIVQHQHSIEVINILNKEVDNKLKENIIELYHILMNDKLNTLNRK